MSGCGRCGGPHYGLLTRANTASIAVSYQSVAVTDSVATATVDQLYNHCIVYSIAVSE